jgi:hypothetical protein
VCLSGATLSNRIHVRLQRAGWRRNREPPARSLSWRRWMSSPDGVRTKPDVIVESMPCSASASLNGSPAAIACLAQVRAAVGSTSSATYPQFRAPDPASLFMRWKRSRSDGHARKAPWSKSAARSSGACCSLWREGTGARDLTGGWAVLTKRAARYGRFPCRLTAYEFSGNTRANARVLSAATRG